MFNNATLWSLSFKILGVDKYHFLDVKTSFYGLKRVIFSGCKDVILWVQRCDFPGLKMRLFGHYVVGFLGLRAIILRI